MDGNAAAPPGAGSGPGPPAVPDPAGGRLRLASGSAPLGRLETHGMARLWEFLETGGLRPGNAPGRPGQPDRGVGGHQRSGGQPAGQAAAGTGPGPGSGRLDPALRAGTAPRLRSPRGTSAPSAAPVEVPLLPAEPNRRIRSGTAPGGRGPGAGRSAPGTGGFHTMRRRRSGRSAPGGTAGGGPVLRGTQGTDQPTRLHGPADQDSRPDSGPAVRPAGFPGTLQPHLRRRVPGHGRAAGGDTAASVGG